MLLPSALLFVCLSLGELFGVELPSSPALVAQVEQRLAEPGWELQSRPTWRPDGERFRRTPAASYTRGDERLNLALIRAGLGVGHFACDDAALEPGELDAALDAAREAQAERRGLFAERRLPQPMDFPLAGVALPMHHKQMDQDYAWELREIKALGARWLNLLVVTRQERVDSSFVPLTSARTPSDARILATIRAARALGLRVQLMPTVMLREAGPKDWRGTLAPADLGQWWRSYDRYICHMADLAAEGGADAFSVGSEFASLEVQAAPWRRVIANVRMRYGGHLTYSANWDHFAEVPFWGQLDFASMTAYFTLCQAASGPSPSAETLAPFATLEDCVEAGWRVGLGELRRLALISGLPAVYSEVGVPSVEGALAGPWDYTLDADPDPAGQALAFRVFHRVFVPGGEPAPFFGGCFLYDYWGRGGLEDKSYSPRGKPAAAEWRAILGDL